MAHFSSRPVRAFAVKMQPGRGLSGESAPIGRIVPDQIKHDDGLDRRRWRNERPSRYRAYMLFELTDGPRILGPVPGIMHAGGDLVDAKTPVCLKKEFDRQNADMAKTIGDALGRF